MKKNIFKKAVAGLLVSTMAVGLLAGCGSGSKEQTIKVMVWDRGNAAPNTTTEDNALTKYIQSQMKELYNINVEYTSVPRSGSDDKLNIMMSGGTAPDIVFTYDQSLYYNYASSGALHELSKSYAEYGQDIAKYCAEAQGISLVGDQKFAVMKQRGTESTRHMAYIRQDWLTELGMSAPTTKEELGAYLKAVVEKKLGGDNTIGWAMAGRTDTEKMYLSFLGSYVNLDSERTSYIYNEAYMAMAPGTEEGLKLLNSWYNAGLISKDFPVDTAEDVYKAAIANGQVGFMLDDPENVWDSIEVLNGNVGHETFVPIYCFDLEDGSADYRDPYEYRYAMFVMIPSTTDDSKVDACMKYLNWLANPDNAVNVRYTPDRVVDADGVSAEPSQDVKDEKGYPGTCDDLGIMNLNYSWSNDTEVLAKQAVASQSTNWASYEWYKSFYDMKVQSPYKFRFPVYSYICEAEQKSGADVKVKMIEFVYNCICSSDFETTYKNGVAELNNAGLQSIFDGRAEYYDSIH